MFTSNVVLKFLAYKNNHTAVFSDKGTLTTEDDLENTSTAMY